MPIVEVRNAKGEVVWRSPEVAEPLVERFDRIVKVFELESGQVVATYELKDGEAVSK